MKLDTDNFGGISTNICTWSGHTSASTIFTSIHIVVVRSFLPQLVFLCKILSGDISVQILYDICNSISYAINYLCHSGSFWMSSFCFLDAVGRPLLYYSKRSFYFFIFGNSLFLNHSPSEWFYITKSRHSKIKSEVTALSIAGIRVPEMKKAPSHLYCVLHQIHIQLFKLDQTMSNCHRPKRGNKGLKSDPKTPPKIGSRLTTLGTTWPSFWPVNHLRTTKN